MALRKVDFNVPDSRKDVTLRNDPTRIDPKKLNRSFAGRELDAAFFRDLPPNVDPCGENGEFHTFVFDGPIFRNPVPVAIGEVVERDSFIYCDLHPTVVGAGLQPGQQAKRAPQ